MNGKFNRYKKKLIRRGISFAVAFVMLLNELYVWSALNKAPVISNIVGSLTMEAQAEENPGADPDFVHGPDNSIEVDITKLVSYSKNCQIYSAYHQEDRIIIVAGQGFSDYFESGFQGIGTANKPFKGSIEMGANTSAILNLDAPLFNYVYDSVTINNGNQFELSRYYQENASTDETTPILARNVLHDLDNSTVRTWNISLVKPSDFNQSDEHNLGAFGGFIGTMCYDSERDAGAKLNVVVTMDTSGTDTGRIALAGSGDMGLACGHMEKKTELSFAISGTRGISGISTSGGDVGGLVGEMEDGSKITYNGANFLGAGVGISTAANDCYAGGLVGKNVGGTVELGVVDLSAEPVVQYTINQNITGTAGAGGVYGYYKPTQALVSTVVEGNTVDNTFNTKKYNLNCQVNGTGSTGGLFGVLVAEHDVTISGNGTVTGNHASGNSDAFGGLIGLYQPDSLDRTLTVTNVTAAPSKGGGATYYGGCVGKIDDDDDTVQSYASFNSVTVNASDAGSLTFGGLVASADNAFVDVNGATVTASGFKGGGLVGSLDHGVLRLDGTVDLSGASPAAPGDGEPNKIGKVVGWRDDALVFAKSTCTLSKSDTAVDDVGSWGQVLKFAEEASVDVAASGETAAYTKTLEKLGGTEVFSVNESTHAVTIAAPSESYTKIASVSDYAKTALCFQLDASINDFINFANTDYTHSNIGAQNISLAANVDLSNTGFVNLTRDNNIGTTNAETKCTYAGTGESPVVFDGKPDSTQYSITYGGSTVYRHSYTGLFGIVNNATIQETTFDGTLNVNAHQKETMYAGSAAGTAKGSFTASDLTVNTTINHDGGSQLLVGGVLGEASTGIGAITVSNITANATITGSASNTCLGGVIGMISHATNTDALTWSFSDIEVSGSIRNTTALNKNQVGGLVAVISGGSGATKRTLDLNDITVKDLQISVKANSNGSVGGVLGYSWASVNADFDGVEIGTSVTDTEAVPPETTVKTPTITQANNGASGVDFAGLVYAGSGYWTLTGEDNVKITALKLNSDNAQSFGMLVNRGWIGNSDMTAINTALYLELQDANAYSIEAGNVAFKKLSASSTNMTIPVFDELVAHTAFYTGSGASKVHYSGDADNLYILQNGQSVVSIQTSGANGGLTMDGSTASGTYTPATSFGQQMNPHSRYYYNLYSIKTATSDEALLMRWALHQYADSSINSYFTYGTGFSDSTIPAPSDGSGTNNYDMAGYSWYPVNIKKNGSVSINGTFKFYNREFESSDNYTSDGHVKRTSLYYTSAGASKHTTQHYLMHSALFYNVNGKINVGAITLQGSVPQIVTDNNKYSGALVLGSVTGTGATESDTAKVTTTSVTLDGVYVYNFNLSDDYAPLLINKSGSYSALKINGVKVNADSSYKTNTYLLAEDGETLRKVDGNPKIATSLIGNVGVDDSSKNVNVNFTNIQLDGRSSHIVPALDSVYHSEVSLFTKATLLNKLSFDTGKGTYTYTYDDDWGNISESNTNPKHNVTYGREVGYTVSPCSVNGVSIVNQYPGEEQKYLMNPEGYYTDPTSSSNLSDTYAETFVSSYLPYVGTAYDSTNHYYQLEVNHSSSRFDGCGTYNDPYTVTDGADFQTIYNILATANDSDPGSIVINIPKSSSTAVGLSATWHTSYGHTAYYYKGADSSDPTNHPAGYYANNIYVNKTDTTNYLTPQQVRTYVAGAYYKIVPKDGGTTVTIPLAAADSGFHGLGNTTDSFAQFRGVIVGTGIETIENKSGFPLIAYSNGSVVKDVNIVVDMNTAAEGATPTTGNISISMASSAAYNTTDGKNYGAVIGSVLGGDNIIDGVTVTFQHTTITLSGNAAQLIPVGGYVGVVLNGGVIFRGMESKRGTAAISGIPAGIVKNESKTDLSLESNKKWLYVNPIIGRVINGFAVTEASAYRPFEDGTRIYHGGAKTLDDGTEDTSGLVTEYWAKNKSDDSIGVVDSDTYNTTEYTLQPVTMRNGNKHYSITDISASESKLDTKGTEADIEVPNGQAFFVMSIAVNSGMSKGSLGYQQTNLISRLAQYTNVEKNLNVASNTVADYNNFAKNDSKEQKSYIWQNYTADNTIISGKTSDNKDNKKTVKLTSTGTYYLPDGYKGIGNFFQNDDNYRMKISSFNGNGATVSQNTYYYFYDSLDATVNCPNANYPNGLGLINYIPVINKDAGSDTFENFYLTGSVKADLINTSDGKPLTTKSARDLDNGGTGAANSKYLSTGMMIGTTARNTTVTNVALRNIDVMGLRSSGGLLGYVPNTSTTLTYTIQSSVARDAYNSEKIKVHGRASTGGLVGKVLQGYAKVDMNNHTFNLTEVVCENKARGGNYYDYGVGGFVGMLRAGQNSIDNAQIPTSNYFKNIVIGTEDQAQTVKCKEGAEIFTAGVVGIMNKCKGINIENCTFYNLSVEAKYAAAGLVAFPTTYTPAVVSNTHLYSPLGSTIESTTDYAGGLIGSSDPRGGSDGSQKFTFNNCSVEGYTISGKKGAGGVIGFRGAINEDLFLAIKNSKVINCTIKSDGAAGGLIGEMNRSVVGYNILAKNVSLKAYTANGSIRNAGYICGRITTTTENVTYVISGNSRTNNISGTTPTIKIAGFSRQADNVSTMEPDLVGACNYGTGFGTGGYVIFADYNDNASSSTLQNKLFANVPSTGTNVSTMRSKTTVVEETYEGGVLTDTDTTVSYGNYVAAATGEPTVTYSEGYEEGASTDYTKTTTTVENENYPYVTSSRKLSIDGTQYLTGDGVYSDNYSTSAFLKITNDRTNASTNKAYTLFPELSDDDDVTAVRNKFSDSFTEFKSYLDTHEGSGIKKFPLLIAEDTNRATLTKLINDYLRTLTNTDYNFADPTNSSIYEVGLYKCTFDESTHQFDVDIGSGTTSGKTACLKTTSATINEVTSYYFKMDAGDVDTGDIPQFSLIDVMFKDPSDTSVSKKIAYHLYVPVYVRKVLRYNFNAEIKSGTDYDRAEYTKLAGVMTEDKRRQGLFENLGNPVTIAFEYQYTRTSAEWAEVLNSGDSLLTNYYKSLTIKNHNGNDWPGVTRMVLVDASNSDKYYYLDSPPPMNDTQTTYISLFDFTDSEGNRFAPAPLQNLTTVTVARSDTGTLTPTEGNTSVGATVYDGTTYYRPIGDEETVEDKYTVTAVTMQPERYYLSIFTKADTTDTAIYRYEISSPDSFGSSGTGVTYTDTSWNVDHWRANKAEKSTVLNLFLGNLYDNHLTLSVAPQKEGSQVMASDNRHLDVTMTANVSLTESAVKAGIPSNMSSFENKAEIYQTFLMMYDKKNADGSSEVGINLAADGAVGEISHKYMGGNISPAVFDMDTASAVTSEQHVISEQYVELRNGQNLIQELYKSDNGYAVTVQAKFEMVYAPNDLSLQFPKKEEGSELDIGSCVIGYSKIASTVEGAANSAAFDKETNTTRYYTSDESTATLEYSVVTSRNIAGQYHYLGINSVETGDAECYVDTYAVYDTRALKTTGDYIELTLTLSNKTAYVQPTVGNPANSGMALPISSYLSELKIYGADLNEDGKADVIFEQSAVPTNTLTCVTTEESKIYKVRVHKSLLKTQTEGVYYIPIDFKVKTGNTSFQNGGLTYANYKVSLTAAMYSAIGSPANGYSKASYAYDHIIYTNARVVPEVIN